MGKRSLLFVMVLAIFAGGCGTQESGEKEQFPQTVQVNAQVCRIRAGAGEEFDVLGLLSEGEIVRVTGIEEESGGQVWYRIDTDSLPDDFGMIEEDCYIQAEFISEAGPEAEAETEEIKAEAEPEPEAKIKGQIFVSFNGEIQGFEADSSGMLRNIEQLAYLAPRGGLGMEEEAGNVPTDSNPCLSESAGMRDMDEILTSESGLTWVRIFGRSSEDSGEGTSVPEHGDIAAYVQEEDLYIAKETGEKDLWNIWKLPGYGEWMEQEIRIFLRVMTGMEAGIETAEGGVGWDVCILDNAHNI